MNVVVIGARILDVLTTGMYPDALDAIREYVQNSFDAIRRAERAGILQPNHGDVTVTINTQKRELSVRDNGIGIPSDEAQTTLLSLGASKKRVGEDAGFRGIGRLAGLAYCEKLIFSTASKDEPLSTELEFDGIEIRKAISASMTTNETASELLMRATKFRRHERTPGMPFFEVKLIGINPKVCPFLDAQCVKSYLRQVAPVEFQMQAFVYARSHVNPFLEKHGVRRTINLTMVADGRHEQIQKPYKTHHPVGIKGASADVHDIETVVDTCDPPKWIAWLSVAKDLSGVINSDEVRGIRLRCKNILVGNYNTFSTVFEKVGKSHARFNGYFSGEIHILDTAIVPNARRDNFEDGEAWREAEKTLIEWADRLKQRAYKDSRDRNRAIDNIVNRTEKAIEDVDAEFAHGFATDELRQKAAESMREQEEILEKRREEAAARRAKLQEGPRSLIDESTLNKGERKVLRMVMDVVLKVCGDEAARKTAAEVNKRLKRSSTPPKNQ